MKNYNEMTREERIEAVKKMDKYVCDTCSERKWMTWIALGVPDAATEDDYEWFADDEGEFKELRELFIDLTGYED